MTTAVDVDTARVEVRHVRGEEYVVRLRDHEVHVDQPVAAGGLDRAPSPVELFVGSMAACAAFYAGRYLDRHGFGRQGLSIVAEYRMATTPPARVAGVRIEVTPPAGLPPRRRQALLAVVEHCTVHNTLRRPLEIDVRLGDGSS
ncbi:hypothetical protein SUDANB95_03468 [Actinosynnema sp. ALI-1.44]